MATLFLHIGTSKAGSTALQEFLAHNRRPLSEHGFVYGPAFAGSNHLELAAAFCTRASRVTRDFGVTDEGDRRRLERSLARRLEATVDDDARWIVSSEHLGTLLSRSEDISALARFLRRFFDRIVVAVVVRRVGYWLPSAYVESIRGGSTKLLDPDYVQQRRRLLDHRRLIRRWQERFEPDQVGALAFLESDKGDPSALSFRVLSALGLTRPDHVAWSAPPHLSNASMSAYATEVLRLANPRLRISALRPVAARRRVLSFITATWPGPALKLTPEAAGELRVLELDDVTLAESRFAIGGNWEEWAAQPAPRTREQVELSDAERAEAFAILSREGLLGAADASPGSAALARAAASLRLVWQRLGRPLRRR